MTLSVKSILTIPDIELIQHATDITFLCDIADNEPGWSDIYDPEIKWLIVLDYICWYIF